jgi:hypothetical protein
MTEMPVFYEWLNPITDEVDQKADMLNISGWEAAGLREDAPVDAKKAFDEYVKDEEHWRKNYTESRPL